MTDIEIKELELSKKIIESQITHKQVMDMEIEIPRVYELAAKAIQKRIPMKKINYKGLTFCPSCGSPISFADWCRYCGQHIVEFETIEFDNATNEKTKNYIVQYMEYLDKKSKIKAPKNLDEE